MQEVLIQNLHEPLEAVYLKFAYKRRHFGSSLVTTPPTHSMTKSCSFSTRELRAYARASCRYDAENGKNSGEVKTKLMIILKEFCFFRFSWTSGASDWQACEDSHWNKSITYSEALGVYRCSKAFFVASHRKKTHDTKCNGRFCPQSYAITEKAFEHL